MDNKLQNAEDLVSGLQSKLTQAKNDLDKVIVQEAKRVLKKVVFNFSDMTKMYYDKKKAEFVQFTPNGETKLVYQDTIADIYRVNPKFRAFLKSH